MTYCNEQAFKDVHAKRKEIRRIVVNDNDQEKLKEFSKLENEINIILTEIKQNKREILKKNKYYMRDLTVKNDKN